MANCAFDRDRDKTNAIVRQREAGFTVVELCATIVLIGLMLAFGIARVDTVTWKLDTATKEVMQRLRSARALAVLRQHDVIVSFDVEARALIVHEDVNGDGLVDEDERVVRHRLGGKVQFERGEAPPFAGFTNAAVSFQAGAVTFLRNGSASQEGAVYVGWPGAVKGRVVVVRRATGYAEVHRYNGSQWSAG
jgi:Tfp pilus assembly protein FimT